MSDERECPVAWRHRIDMPVCVGIRRDRNAHSALLSAVVGVATSDPTQPTPTQAAPAALIVTGSFVVAPRSETLPACGGTPLTLRQGRIQL
jgi:hypothetical protein